MDDYSQKMPGIHHRRKDHEPLRIGDYEDSSPQLDKWRIVYRLFHIAVDCWWTNLSKRFREIWRKEIRNGRYPFLINWYFWQMIECIVKDPLGVYKLLPWACNPLPIGWVEYIRKNKK